MTHLYRCNYGLGEFVRLRIDREESVGQIRSIEFMPGGIMICVIWPDCSVSDHYEVELVVVEPEPAFEDRF